MKNTCCHWCWCQCHKIYLCNFLIVAAAAAAIAVLRGNLIKTNAHNLYRKIEGKPMPKSIKQNKSKRIKLVFRL